MFFNASSAFAAFFSCMTPIVALSTMTTRMTMHSASPSPSMKYIASENAAASSRIMTMTSVSCSMNILSTVLGFFWRRLFLPYWTSLFAASSSLKPSTVVSRHFSVSSTVIVCQSLCRSDSIRISNPPFFSICKKAQPNGYASIHNLVLSSIWCGLFVDRRRLRTYSLLGVVCSWDYYMQKTGALSTAAARKASVCEKFAHDALADKKTRALMGSCKNVFFRFTF